MKTDPIFAAIERHQAAVRAASAAAIAEDNASGRGLPALLKRAFAAEDAAKAAFLAVHPKTEAGFRAMRAHEATFRRDRAA